MVRLLARSQGREPAPTPQALQGCASGRRLLRLPSPLRRRQYLRSGLLGPRPAQVPRDPHRASFTDDDRSGRAHRGALRHRAEIRGSTAEVRRTIRQARARPRLVSMRVWLESTLAKLSRKSDTAAAIRYALSRWPALTRYIDDGQLEIDNNAAERALRVVALGRKNFLFAGSNAGGQRAAAIYSLLGSAKLNGLDPELYLHHILEQLPWNVSLPTQYDHS